MLEVGKLYIVKSVYYTWLFKKSSGHDITSCSGCVCLDDNSCFKDGGRICSDDCIAWIKPASRNYVSIWNRMFDDNLKMDCYD